MDIMGLSIRLILGILAFVAVSAVSAQSAHREWRQADKLFDKEEYNLAEKKYSSAAEKQSDPALHYNWGNALYEQEAYADAIQQYQQSLSLPDMDEDLRFKAHHNKGNAHARSGEWEKAIADYQEALKLNPDHDPTRENLWRAMQQLPPPQEQPQQGDRSEESDEEQEEQEGQQPNEMDSEADEDAQADEEQMDGDRPLSKEELERLMQAVEREDARVQESRRREGKANKKRPLKDW